MSSLSLVGISGFAGDGATADVGVFSFSTMIEFFSGVRAGAAGGFAAVVGVDRGVGHAALAEAGADLVVSDLDELTARA